MKRVVIVGAGRIAGLYERNPDVAKPCTHGGAYSGDPNFDIVGLIDKDLWAAESMAAEFQIPRVGTNLLAMLHDLRPDLVSIAVPYHLHHEIVAEIAASDAPPHQIFCEKPMADTVAHAEAMLSACRNTSIALYINNRRLVPIYEEMRTIVSEEFSGEIVTFAATSSSGLRAVGIHMLDLIRFICGEAAWVQAVPERGDVQSIPHSENFVPSDPRVTSLIGLESGPVGTFTSTGHTGYVCFELDILCKTGRVRAIGNGENLEVYKMPPPEEFATSYRLGAPDLRPFPTTPLFQRIAEALRVETDDHPLDAKHGLETIRFLDAIADSAKHLKRVTLRRAA